MKFNELELRYFRKRMKQDISLYLLFYNITKVMGITGNIFKTREGKEKKKKKNSYWKGRYKLSGSSLQVYK